MLPWRREEAAAAAHLPPLEPLDVEIGESEALLAAGTISSIMEGTIVVQVWLSSSSFVHHLPCLSSMLLASASAKVLASAMLTGLAGHEAQPTHSTNTATKLCQWLFSVP